MKKLLLSLALLPVALSAQSYKEAGYPYGNPIKTPIGPLFRDANPENITVVKLKDNSASNGFGLFKYDPKAIQIGTTTYDLQTNNSMPRRVRLYDSGMVSIVWTNSNSTSSDFLDRGTVYVHFDGSDWTQPNTTRLEGDRAGWPELVNYTKNGVQREMIISHYASGGTNVSGGLYWMTNSKVGDPNFSTLFEKDKPNGPLWPRAASTGNLIHVIAVYNSDVTQPNPVKKSGVINPIVYYRYNTDKDSFEADGITLPGYDSSHYYQGSADEYAIDAKDSIVAVVTGGTWDDVAMWKSTDYGKTWKKTIINKFPRSPYDVNSDGGYDSTSTNNGNVSVIIDNNNVVHVFYPQVSIQNTDTTDGQYSFWVGRGIAHWSETSPVLSIIAGVSDINGDSLLTYSANNYSSGYGSYGVSLANYPIATVDANNNIYLLYSAINETDLEVTETAVLRDIYVSYLKDGETNWSAPQTISSDKPGFEDVFPSVSRRSDDYLHIDWMRDDQSGIFLRNEQPGALTTNSMMYAKIPVADVLNNELGLFDATATSVNKVSSNDLFKVGKVYPNPTSGQATLSIHMNRSAFTVITITDMVGHSVMQPIQQNLPAGNSNLDLDLTNFAKGVYFCQINAGGFTTTQKVIVK
jgi:hypothetical protein